MKAEELKNRLIKAIFPQGEPRILIKKAKERVGKKQYRWLIEYAGAAKKGKSADVVEKGIYLIHISAVEKALRAAEDILELPTISELEGVKKTRQFRRPSLLLAYLLAVVFFSIGFIPDKPWWLKIALILLSFFLIRFLNNNIFSILEKID